MKNNSIKKIGRSDFVNMGPIKLRQSIPAEGIDLIDPFVLLHHYGPYTINEFSNPFDLGPHPHRGFEPITFLIDGEQLHRDSLGNESVVEAGDVQWTTAGRGIVHAEGPTKEFVKRGGTMEGIQLWLNLPAAKKMMPANYQHIKKEDFLVHTSPDQKVKMQIIAGAYEDTNGRIGTQTPVNAFVVDAVVDGEIFLKVPKSHNGLIYLLKGDVTINETEELKLNDNQMIWFEQNGDGFSIKASADSKLLFLSGEPINEEIKSWGPYVMNNQTEIMEALRDYQQGKMGYLTA